MSNDFCKVNLSGTKEQAESGLGLTFFYSGIEECEPGHYWLGIRDHYNIHFILKGHGTCSYGDDIYELGEGQAFLARPMQKVHYAADMKEPWTYCWAAFSGVNAKTLLDYTDFGSDKHIAGFGNIEDVENTIRKLKKTDAGKPGQYTLVVSYLLYLISRLDSKNEYEKSRSGVKGRHFDAASNFIDRNYSRNIKINDISVNVGLDRKYLNEIFKEFANVTTQQFLLNKRMDQAAILLSDASLSIKEIAHSVGYYDPLLFSKMFKKKYGISPNGFRERM